MSIAYLKLTVLLLHPAVIWFVCWLFNVSIRLRSIIAGALLLVVARSLAPTAWGSSALVQHGSALALGAVVLTTFFHTRARNAAQEEIGFIRCAGLALLVCLIVELLAAALLAVEQYLVIK